MPYSPRDVEDSRRRTDARSRDGENRCKCRPVGAWQASNVATVAKSFTENGGAPRRYSAEQGWNRVMELCSQVLENSRSSEGGA
jgi:hypothetical protein